MPIIRNFLHFASSTDNFKLRRSNRGPLFPQRRRFSWICLAPGLLKRYVFCVVNNGPPSFVVVERWETLAWAAWAEVNTVSEKTFDFLKFVVNGTLKFSPFSFPSILGTINLQLDFILVIMYLYDLCHELQSFYMLYI